MEPLNIRSKQDGKRRKPSWSATVPGLVLLNSSFAPIAFNHAGAAILKYPKQPRMDPLPIPPEIMEEIRESPFTNALSVMIPFQAGRQEYLCHAFPLHSCHPALAESLFALVLQRSSSADETVYRVAAQFNLTEREREVLEGVLAGLSSRQVATSMRISPNTVKVYLHLIMVKMGVTSRAGIVAKILKGRSIPASNDVVPSD